MDSILEASERTKRNARNILTLLQEEALVRFPAFPEAFGQLTARASDELTAALGTDGEFLYYQPALLCAEFLRDSDALRRAYLHVHLHALCFHTVRPKRTDGARWDMACDLSAELLAQELSPELFPDAALLTGALRAAADATSRAKALRGKVVPAGSTGFGRSPAAPSGFTETPCNPAAPSGSAGFGRSPAAPSGFTETPCSPAAPSGSAGAAADIAALPRTAAALLPLLDSDEKLRELAGGCARDSHQFWTSLDAADSGRTAGRCSGNSGGKRSINSDAQRRGGHSVSGREQLLRQLEDQQKKWTLPRKRLLAQHASGSGRRGKAAGNTAESAKLKQQDAIDYRSFLRRFTVAREEAILDMDAFDYIPYHFGLTHYGNMPFIEPLEYREVNRLDELAIAIDTSASCSGRIVRRFLEETWAILRQRENFFARMRLHLFQCDSMIQEHRVFTSVEEWEAALPGLKILGQGNTDFRPVFESLDRMIACGEIRRLRGLLYFTDGDGIFPRTAPPYDAAFVFLNDRLEKQKIPDWGIRLNLNLPDEIL